MSTTQRSFRAQLMDLAEWQAKFDPTATETASTKAAPEETEPKPIVQEMVESARSVKTVFRNDLIRDRLTRDVDPRFNEPCSSEPFDSYRLRNGEPVSTERQLQGQMMQAFSPLLDLMGSILGCHKQAVENREARYYPRLLAELPVKYRKGKSTAYVDLVVILQGELAEDQIVLVDIELKTATTFSDEIANKLDSLDDEARQHKTGLVQIETKPSPSSKKQGKGKKKIVSTLKRGGAKAAHAAQGAGAAATQGAAPSDIREKQLVATMQTLALQPAVYDTQLKTTTGSFLTNGTRYIAVEQTEHRGQQIIRITRTHGHGSNNPANIPFVRAILGAVYKGIMETMPELAPKSPSSRGKGKSRAD